MLRAPCLCLGQVKSVFQSSNPAPDQLWRDGDSTAPAHVPASDGRGRYHYLRAEHCAGGDLEGLVRRVGPLHIPDVRAVLFQMCFALYATREQLMLRHNDVKLLNFLVTRGVDALAPPERAAAVAADAILGGHGAVHLKIGFGEAPFTVPLSASGLGLVKLADFGASAAGPAALGRPINAAQFTTLENTPPEFLVLGSTARQVMIRTGGAC